jgi:pSer/pThr/pTyr-binding forkhead associated (FHA) protein
MESLAVVPPVARLLLLTPRSEALQGIIPEEISLARPRLLVGRPSHSVAVDVPLSVLSGGSDIISRRHAELQRTLDGKHIVRDAGALNGT